MGEFLIGRTGELAILERSLADAEAGKGGVVLVAGEPGIGKTRLLDELCARAERRSFRVLRAPHATGRHARADLIRSIVGLVPPNEVDPRWLANTASLNTDIETRPASQQDIRPQGDDSHRAGREIEGYYYSLLRLFEQASREQPLLLTLEDLENASESALALIRFANASFREMPILLLAAYSQYGTRWDGQGGSAVESIARSCRRVNLTGLSLAMTGELLSQVLGNATDSALIRQVYELTGGNPSLILQAANSCLAQGGTLSELVPSRVPEAIRLQIVDVLAALSRETREVLRVASAIGKTFTIQLVLGLLPFSREHGLAALSEAEEAGVLRSAGINRFQFVKSFVKWVLYAEFSTAEKAALHQRIAAALEASAENGDGSHVGDLALHLLASRDTKSIRHAMEIAQSAGAASAKALDWQGAIIMYSMALEALDLAECSDEARRCDLLRALAEAQNHAGDIDTAQESLYDAAEIANRLEDWSRLAEVVIAAPALNWPFSGQPNALVIGLAERVLSLLPESDIRRRALVMARWAAELSHLREERKQSEQLSARALGLLKELGDDEQSKLQLLQLRDWILQRPESIPERLANGAEVSRIARRLGQWPAVFKGEWARNVCLFQSDPARLGNALGTLEHAARLAGPRYECYRVALRAIQSIFCGKFAEGEQLFATCREMARESGVRGLADQFWVAMMLPLYEQERLAEVEPIVERWSQTAPAPTLARCWMAAKLGRFSEARFHLEWLAADGFAILKDSRSLLVGAATLTDVCTDLGDVPHHAAVLYQLLRPHEKRNAALGAFVAFGAVSRYLGKLALLLSDFDEAVDYFQDAVAFNNRLGGRPWTAYATHELAAALLARGHSEDRHKAVSLLASAYTEATAMGMGRLARSIRACVDQLELVDSDSIIEAHDHHLLPGRADTATPGLVPSEPVPFPLSKVVSDPLSVETQPGPVGSDRSAEAVFRFEGDHWAVGYGGTILRFGQLKGLNLIAYLLNRPNQEVHALELDDLIGYGSSATSDGTQRVAGASDLGPILDHSAKQAYRQRLQELREDLEEALSFNDLERASSAEEEIRSISRELTRAVGLAGRDRKMGSETERARLRVTSAIKWTIKRISSQHRSLGRFLELSIKTGTLCSYVPDANSPRPDWKL